MHCAVDLHIINKNSFITFQVWFLHEIFYISYAMLISSWLTYLSIQFIFRVCQKIDALKEMILSIKLFFISKWCLYHGVMSKILQLCSVVKGCTDLYRVLQTETTVFLHSISGVARFFQGGRGCRRGPNVPLGGIPTCSELGRRVVATWNTPLYILGFRGPL